MIEILFYNKKTFTFTILHNDDKLLFDDETINVLNNIWMSKFFNYLKLNKLEFTYFYATLY